MINQLPPVKDITLPVSLIRAKEAIGTLHQHFNKYTVKNKDEYLNTYCFLMLVLLQTYDVEITLSKISDEETKLNITARPSIGAIDNGTEVRKCNEIITNTLGRISEILQGRVLPKQPKTTEEICAAQDKWQNENPKKSKTLVIVGIVAMVSFWGWVIWHFLIK